jgi:hypothetical protein
MTRQQLDGRNSDTRDDTVYEKISDRWNNDMFNPSVQPSLCHEDYRNTIDCSHSFVDKLLPATPTKVQNHLSGMRADLIRIIINWEQSGQGDSGHRNSDGEDSEELLEHGQLTGRARQALDRRANFLNGKPSYLLVLWELADEHQLLQSTLQRLDNSVGVSDPAGTPSVINIRQHNLMDTEGTNLVAAISDVQSGMQSTAAAMIRNAAALEHNNTVMLLQTEYARLSSLEDQQRQYSVLSFSATNPREREYYEAALTRVDKQIEECHKERRRLQRMNSSSAN